jgi:anti-sigma factor RsiW
MKLPCKEAQELIAALVDHELTPAEEAMVREHLGSCAACQAALSRMEALKSQLRAAAAAITAPGSLLERIRSEAIAFRHQAFRLWWQRVFSALRPSFSPAWALAALLLLSLALFQLAHHRKQELPLALLTHYRAILEEPGLLRASSLEEMKRYLARGVGGKFQPMGYDLAAVGLAPAGGAIRDIGGRKVLAVVYRGERLPLLCFTFLGSESEAPPDAQRFYDAPKRVYLYAFSRAGLNAVMHREKEAICLLVSEMPLPELLALAVAKASPA